MRAAVCTKYGSPENVKVVDLAKPSPKKNEILVKIEATTVASGDARIRRADPAIIRLIFGFRKPRKSVLGVVVAGKVEQVGADVTKFKVEDRVFGTTGMSFGAHAEYTCIKESGTLSIMPEKMEFTEAASIPFGGTAAIHFLRKGKVQKGSKVLIYGASGAIGTLAIQLAKELGAEVTGVCSGKNVRMVKNLGADYVIDYKKDNFSKNGIKYDVIFDTVGKSSFSDGFNSLTKEGKLLLASANVGQMIWGGFRSLFGKRKVITGVIKETVEDMRYFKKLIEQGKLVPTIDSTYSLSQIAEAHARVDSGHKKGNVILTMNESK
ncbi:MAG: NAD(P)-dependent alcohol dehydrogenase [Crocinitomicaceae bacterium]